MLDFALRLAGFQRSAKVIPESEQACIQHLRQATNIRGAFLVQKRRRLRCVHVFPFRSVSLTVKKFQGYQGVKEIIRSAGMKPKSLLTALKKIKGMKVTKIKAKYSMDAPKYKPVHLRTPDGILYLLLEDPADLSDHIKTLHSIVDAYKTRASLDRTSQTLIDSFHDIHEDLTALVIFPQFKIRTLLKLAGQNIVLPTGITRFTVSPRALHLNYPLHELSSGKPIEYKQDYLQHWIDQRVKKKGVRMYSEATFLFDE